MATMAYRPDLGRVGGEVAAALAWLHSPATIADEIARLEAAQREGDRTEAIGVQLADWRTPLLRDDRPDVDFRAGTGRQAAGPR